MGDQLVDQFTKGFCQQKFESSKKLIMGCWMHRYTKFSIHIYIWLVVCSREGELRIGWSTCGSIYQGDLPRELWKFKKAHYGMVNAQTHKVFFSYAYLI